MKSVCSNCGTVNRASAKFCHACASPELRQLLDFNLDVRADCPHCKAKGVPKGGSCDQCGKHLS